MSWESTIVGFITHDLVASCNMNCHGWLYLDALDSIHMLIYLFYKMWLYNQMRTVRHIEKICTQWNCEMCSFGYQIEFDPDVIPSDPIQAAYAKFKKLYRKNVCVCAQKEKNEKKLHSIRKFYATTHISDDVIFSIFFSILLT